MRGRRLFFCTASLVFAVALLLGCFEWGFAGIRQTRAFADADDRILASHGRLVYAQHCAVCHGRALQGQPLWQVQDANTSRRAPALDRFGPAWQQSDAELLRIIKFGSVPAAPAMPAFDTVLTHDDILASLAFIKGRWPIGLRVAQAMLNPGHVGMPRDAERSAWQFSPKCAPGPAGNVH